MAGVPTTSGWVDSSELGLTLMHEHLFTLNKELDDNYPGDWDEELRRADAVDKLHYLESVGVSSLVDLTVLGLGRFIPRVKEVAEHTTINVIVATGVYTYRDLPLYFHFRGPGRMIDGPEYLTEFLIDDIREGIAGTGVRAAILKCSTDEIGVTPDIDRALRCVAQAHRETGVPITTHTHAATHRGLDQLRIFDEEGVDPTRVIIGHSGDSKDRDYLRRLLDTGAYIGMDRFGLDVFATTPERVATVAQLALEGFADQMLLSTDAPCFSHNLEPARAEHLPNWNWPHLFDDVIPALREAGITDAQLNRMLVDNPRRIFERVDTY